MPWDVTVAGTVHLDDITTPLGHEPRLCGGSAVYFSLAAAPRATVHFNGIVGADTETEFRQILRGLPIDLTGMVVSPQPTFRWHAIHDFDRWIAIEVAAEPGCDPEWRPQLSSGAAAAEVLFLGSMHPHLQRALLDQSSARLIGSDSMTIFIGPELDAVRDVATSSDVLFLNRSELAALSPAAADWRSAAAGLIDGAARLRAVVVKGGPDGAALVTADTVIELPATPIETVVDPTGAGDALAGGFLGACAAAERSDADFFPTALEAGLRCAAAAIGDFGTAGLRRPVDSSVRPA